MGNSLCLSQREKKVPEYATARVSPIPTYRKRRRESDACAPSSLQDLCVAVVAKNAARLDISVMPMELIQRVADYLVDEGERAQTSRGKDRKMPRAIPQGQLPLSFESGCAIGQYDDFESWCFRDGKVVYSDILQGHAPRGVERSPDRSWKTVHSKHLRQAGPDQPA